MQFEQESIKISTTTPLKKVVENYIEYYAQGTSHTARAKRIDLTKFLEFLRVYKGVSKVEKLTLADWNYSSIQRFTEESLAIESPSTVARRLATIKHMGRTYAEKIPNFINPAKEVKTPKIKPPIPKALTDEEIKLVKQKAKERISSRDSFIRYRNSVLFSFFLETGLRADEIRLLRLSQLDQNLEWIISVRTKGKRYRNVYINSDLRKILIEYLKKREDQLQKLFPKIPKNTEKNLPLFISTYKAKLEEPKTFQMGAKTIWRAIHELSVDDVCRGTELHPHLLRHTFALGLLNSSNDIRLVSQALGHNDVKITMRYTERTDIEVAQAIEKKIKK